jgi:hypothetical protein
MHHREKTFSCEQNSYLPGNRIRWALLYTRALVILGCLAGLPLSGLASSRARAKDAKPAVTAGSFTLTLAPATVTFPTQAVGTPSLPVTVVLSDYTNSTPVLSSLAISGDFSQTNTCGQSVPIGDQCYISITFTPTAAGTRTGTLTVTSNASNSPQTVALSGTAGPAGFSPTTTDISSSGTAGSYTLSGTVSGIRSKGSPTGAVSFLDTTNGNLSLGQASLGSSAVALSFADGPSTLSGRESSEEVVADFNGDGKPDFAVYICDEAECPSPTISVWLGKGDGTFTQSATFAADGDLVAGDFNGDGKTDIAIGGNGNSYNVEFGNGNGTFTLASIALGSAITNCSATADFNGDGNADLVCLNATTATVLLGQKNETFVIASGTGSSIVAPWTFVAGDFNGDGNADFALLGSSSNSAGDLTAMVSLGNGDGTFQSPVTTSGGNQMSSWNSAAGGDFNGDGKTDLVIKGSVPNGPSQNADGFVALLSKGDGSFIMEPLVAISPTPTYSGVTYASNSGSVAVTDLNGDGKGDLAVLTDDVVQVLLSNGDGTFKAAASIDSGAETDPDWLAVAFADFNGDGIPDVAALNSDAGDVTIFFTEHTLTAPATATNISVPGSGSHNIEAVYAGDANFSTSTSSTIPLTASPIVTTLALTSSASQSSSGVQLTLSATLSPYSSQSLTTNTEKVTFSNNGTAVGSGTLSSGVATLNIGSLPVGTDSLTASYAGDANFAAAKSSVVPVTVTAASPSVTLSPASLTFASQNTGSTSTAQNVTLTNSGQAALLITSVAATGDFAETNTCGTSLAPAAICNVAVTFTPTASGSRTGMLTITDNAAGSPQTVALSGTGSDVSVSATPTGLTVTSPGGSARATIQISSVGSFSGTVTLSCTVQYQGTGTPTNPPTCTLSPSQQQVSAASPGSATITIGTMAAGETARLHNWWITSGSTLAALLFWGFVPRRRGTKLFALLLVAVAFSVVGCGGGSNQSTGGNGAGSSATTTGNYSVVVTATGGTVKTSTQIALSVQ